jgi:hypothetical protein
MSDLLNLNQPLELRDAAGHTVVILSPKAAQELTAERDQLRNEVTHLRAEIAELNRALEDARKEVSDKAAIVAERDLYYRELESLMAEKIAYMNAHGIDGSEVIAEIEADLRARGMLDDK